MMGVFYVLIHVQADMQRKITKTNALNAIPLVKRAMGLMKTIARNAKKIY